MSALKIEAGLYQNATHAGLLSGEIERDGLLQNTDVVNVGAHLTQKVSIFQ